MKKFLNPIKNLIFYDIKKLIIIETLIKIIGFVVIYPLFRLGFYFSLQFSGLKYISNKELIYYLTKPSTILLAVGFILVFGIFLILEYVYLALLFEDAYKKNKRSYKEFFIQGLKRYLYVLRRYHLIMVIPVLLFFILFEYTQIFIFSSTIKLPEPLLVDLQSINYTGYFVVIAFILLFIFFIEFSFFTQTLITNPNSIRFSFKYSRRILYGQRSKLMIRMMIFNILMYILLFAFYAIIIFIAGQIIGLYRGSEVVFGIIVTSIYSVYWIANIIFSSILIPVNIAIISYKYHQSEYPLIRYQHIQEPVESKKTSQRKITIALSMGFLVVFALNIVSITSGIRNTENQFQIFKQEEIIAHRGASMDAPENTLAALELAIQQGADAVEFDVKGTKDNVPILLHDDTLIRTTDFDVKLDIKHIEYEIVQKYEAGGWFSEEFYGEKIPTLEEALELIAGRITAFIDVKTTNPMIEAEIVRLIEVYGMENSVKILSFDANQLQRFKELNPNLETVLLISVFFGQIDTLFDLDYIDHFGLRISILQRDPEIAYRIHRFGKKVYAWTADTREDIAIGVKADVDGFITKRPIEAREIAHSKSSNETFTELLQRLFGITQ